MSWRNLEGQTTVCIGAGGFLDVKARERKLLGILLRVHPKSLSDDRVVTALDSPSIFEYEDGERGWFVRFGCTRRRSRRSFCRGRGFRRRRLHFAHSRRLRLG